MSLKQGYDEFFFIVIQKNKIMVNYMDYMENKLRKFKYVLGGIFEVRKYSISLFFC